MATFKQNIFSAFVVLTLAHPLAHATRTRVSKKTPQSSANAHAGAHQTSKPKPFVNLQKKRVGAQNHETISIGNKVLKNVSEESLRKTAKSAASKNAPFVTDVLDTALSVYQKEFDAITQFAKGGFEDKSLLTQVDLVQLKTSWTDMHEQRNEVVKTKDSKKDVLFDAEFLVRFDERGAVSAEIQGILLNGQHTTLRFDLRSLDQFLGDQFFVVIASESKEGITIRETHTRSGWVSTHFLDEANENFEIHLNSKTK